MISKEPYRLTTDGDGHYYMVPESQLARFEEVMSLLGNDVYDAKIQREANAFVKYSVDGPHTLRFYHWEETT